MNDQPIEQRRGHERFDIANWASLSLLDESGNVTHRLSGHMSNVSRSGLGVTTPEEIEPGTVVIVSFLGRKHLNSRYGVVRRNTGIGGYMSVGIEFQPCPDEVQRVLASEQQQTHTNGINTGDAA